MSNLKNCSLCTSTLKRGIQHFKKDVEEFNFIFSKLNAWYTYLPKSIPIYK